MKLILHGLLRHGLQILGVALVGKGIIDLAPSQEQISAVMANLEIVAGAFSSIGAIFWEIRASAKKAQPPAMSNPFATKNDPGPSWIGRPE
jgi:hypothetical protein